MHGRLFHWAPPRLRIPATVAAVIVALSWTTASTAQNQDDHFDAAVRWLDRAVTSQPRGDHLALLLSLRQISDESLRPLFLQLVQHLEWQVQVHAVLGLAELDRASGNEDAHIDPWLATQVQPTGHETLVSAAIDADLIGPKQMQEILRSQGVAPMAQAMLLGELILLGEDVDDGVLRTLAESPDIRAAGLASCLLAQVGDATAFSAFRTRLSTKTKPHRLALEEWLYDAIGQYRLSALSDWVIAELQGELAEEDSIQREAAAFALLRCSPDLGRAEWLRIMSENPRYSQQVRYAMLYVGSETPVDAAVEAVLQKDDELLRAIARAGKAANNGTGANVAPAFKALIERGHTQSVSWILHVISDHRPAGSVDALEFMIDRFMEKDNPSDAEAARAIRAASVLFELDAPRVLSRLETVKDDSIHQQVLLLSMYTSLDTRAGDAASKVRRIGTGRADSLALTLQARHAKQMNATDLNRLGAIASGGGRVSEGIRAQAAWLYLKHSGRIDAALSRLVPK